MCPYAQLSSSVQNTLLHCSHLSPLSLTTPNPSTDPSDWVGRDVIDIYDPFNVMHFKSLSLCTLNGSSGKSPSLQMETSLMSVERFTNVWVQLFHKESVEQNVHLAEL